MWRRPFTRPSRRPIHQFRTRNAPALATLTSEFAERVATQAPRAWKRAVASDPTSVARIARNSIPPPAALAIGEVDRTRGRIRVPELGFQDGRWFRTSFEGGGGQRYKGESGCSGCCEKDRKASEREEFEEKRRRREFGERKEARGKRWRRVLRWQPLTRVAWNGLNGPF
jgi:hypothetical protein